MKALWLQEIVFLILIFAFIFIIYNTYSFFSNKKSFKQNMKLSLKYIAISFLIFLLIPLLLLVINKF